MDKELKPFYTTRKKPDYWQLVKEYIDECEHEANFCKTLEEFKKDLTLWIEHYEDFKEAYDGT